MEFPTTEWDIFESQEFNLAAPRGTGEAVLELMMQLRPNGRIQDHFRVALAGNKLMSAAIGFGVILPTKELHKVQIALDFWVKDIVIRRNMATSEWTDLYEGITQNQIRVEDRQGTAVSADDRAAILTILEESETYTKSASLRYAVVVGPDSRMWLELQGLPGTAKMLNSKPAFTG